MWIYDLETLRFLEVNDAAVAHYGFSRREFEAMTLYDIRPESERARLKANLESSREAFQRSGTWLHRRKDGEILEVAIDSHITMWNGRRAALVIARDVTERNRVARENLRFGEELQALLQVAQQLSRSLERDVVLRQTLEGAMVLLSEAHVAAIWLITDDGNAAYAAAWVRRDGEVALANDTATEADLLTRDDPVLSNVLSKSDPEHLDAGACSHLLDLPGGTARLSAAVAAPLWTPSKPVGALVAGSRSGEEPFGARHIRLMHALASQAAIALANASLVEDIRRVPQELIKAQEDERRRLARELHDEVGAQLTSLSLCLTMLRPAVPQNDDRALESLRHAGGLLEALTEEVRSMALRLRPSVLDDLGLLAAVNWLARQHAGQTGLRIDFQHNLDPELRFEPAVELTAFRVIQEAVTNAARHAQVSQVQVEISVGEDEMRIRVQDEGKGFDYEEALRSHRSVGLLGMKERVVQLDGHLDVVSRPGEGVRITATIPLG